MNSAACSVGDPVQFLTGLVTRYPSLTRMLAGGAIIAYLVMIGWAAQHPEQGDFTKFYGSGAALLAGEDPYAGVSAAWVGLEEGSPEALLIEAGHPNLNPPILVFAFAALAVLPFPLAFWTWSALSMPAGGWAARCLGRELNLKPVVPALLLFCFFPTWVNVFYGQVTLFLLALLSLAWKLDREQRESAAGLTLGLFAAVKLFGGLFVIPMLVQRRWKALGGLAFAFTLANSIPLALGRWDWLEGQSAALSKITWHAASWNASFSGMSSRFLGGSENTPVWNQPTAARLLATGLTLAAALFLFDRLRRISASHRATVDTTYALIIPAALLISPLGWIYYFPLLLVGALSLARRHVGGSTSPLLVAGWLVCTVPSAFYKAANVEPYNLGFWTGLLYSLGLLMLLIGAIQSARRLTE